MGLQDHYYSGNDGILAPFIKTLAKGIKKMIRPLRRRHRQVWLVIAVVLPVGILLSWLAIPNPVAIKLIKQPSPELLPVVKYTMDKAEYTINVRANQQNTEWQLEWQNKLALTVPSAVIYKIPATVNLFSADSSQLIGRIEAKGDYVFPVLQDAETDQQINLVIYDFIHKKIIDSLTYKISL